MALVGHAVSQVVTPLGDLLGWGVIGLCFLALAILLAILGALLLRSLRWLWRECRGEVERSQAPPTKDGERLSRHPAVIAAVVSTTLGGAMTAGVAYETHALNAHPSPSIVIERQDGAFKPPEINKGR